MPPSKAPQLGDHAKRILAGLIVAGQTRDLAEAERPIERTCAEVVRAHLELNAVDATAARQGLQPAPQRLPHADASQPGIHGHQQQVGLAAREAEAHDREADHAPVGPRHHRRSLGIGDASRYGLWRPPPRETSLDQPARHLCDRCRIGRASGLEPDLRNHDESVPFPGPPYPQSSVESEVFLANPSFFEGSRRAEVAGRAGEMAPDPCDRSRSTKGQAGVPGSFPREEGPCARPRTAKTPVTALPS